MGRIRVEPFSRIPLPWHDTNPTRLMLLGYIWIRLKNPTCLHLAFFIFFFGTHLRDKPHYYDYCSWTVAAMFDFFHPFQHISGSRVLFRDPQTSLFSNFFIKNRSHGTIHTFKNYFATVFFSFQFSTISKRTHSLLHRKIINGM